jgi:hypothetical protein
MSVADAVRKLELDFTRLDKGRFDVNHPPEKPVPVISLCGHGLSTPGNLSVFAAQLKTAKTSAIMAALASMMTAEGDCLGFTGTWTGGAWIHLDSEQSPFDFDRAIRVVLRRAGLDSPPEWLRSYSTVHLDIDERRELFFAELERASKEHGRLSGASVDGVADMCHDPNDSAEAFALVSRLNRAAAHYGCPIIVSLHENPGTDNGKTRGHLGSELARKAETNLSLAKDAKGIVTMFTERSRSCHIPKDTGPRFAWDDDAGMHLSCGSAPQAETPTKYTVQNLIVKGQEIAKEALISKANGENKIGIQKAKGFISELIGDGIFKVIEKPRPRTNPAIFLERVI